MKQSDITTNWARFLSIMQSNDDTDSLANLLNFLLTHDERAMIATRLLLTKELLQKKRSQRDIAATFGISIAMITRGSNELKRLTDEQKSELETLFDA